MWRRAPREGPSGSPVSTRIPYKVMSPVVLLHAPPVAYGYIRQHVVAAVIVHFLQSGAHDRTRMLDNLECFLEGQTECLQAWCVVRGM
jgi:hypothetical protein